MPLEEPAMPTPTWKALAHSDSTASIEADEHIVADRVDSVALAHMRLDKLNKANDSLAVARKRLSGINSQDTGSQGSGSMLAAESGSPHGVSRVGGDPEASSPEPASPEPAASAKKSPPAISSGLKKLGGVFRKGLHLGKDSPSAKSQDLPRDSAGSEGVALGERDFHRKSSSEKAVRFSMDDKREIVE